MSWLKKIKKVVNFSPAKAVYDGFQGNKEKANKVEQEAHNTLKENVSGAKDTANKLEDLGIKQAQDINKLKEMLMQGLNYQKQNLKPVLDNTNKEYNQAKENQNAYLASIGYRPETNNVFLKANAELENERNKSLTGIQNQANQQYFNNLMQGLQVGSGINNTLYGGQLNALLQGQGLKQNALNAQTAYLGNKYQSSLQNQANTNSALIGLLGTLGGAFLGGPLGASAGGFLNGLFTQGKK